MLLLNEIIEFTDSFHETLTLPFDIRQKSRMKAVLDNGEEVSLLLPRGSILRHGCLLRSESGYTVKILAAQENVSIVSSQNTLLLMKACYHLGNRHVPLQICDDFIQYQKDHVLDAMIEGLGLNVSHVEASFEPESGAYAH